jgi:hypothetical protein
MRMTNNSEDNAADRHPQSANAIAAELPRLSPAYAPTPPPDLPRLAVRFGVRQVLAKYEGSPSWMGSRRRAVRLTVMADPLPQTDFRS